METASITVQHPQLYFRDGNIILRVSNEMAEAPASNAIELPQFHLTTHSSTNSTGHTLFRVHKGVLSHHSGTFSAMFDIPLAEEREVIDDCDVVDLHDSVADIEKLLKIIYGLAPTYHRLHWASFCYYAPIIPVADKYEMTDIRKKYLVRIFDGWPRSLTEWDAFEAELEALCQRVHRFNELKRNRMTDEDWTTPMSPTYMASEMNPENEIDYTGRYFDDILVAPDHFIRFAEDNSQHDVLPGAYYHISRIPYIRIEADDPETLVDYLSAGGLRTGYSKLQFSHLERLYIGKNRLRHQFSGMINSPWSYFPDAWRRIHTTEEVDSDDVDTPQSSDCDPKEWWIRHVRGVALDAEVRSDGDILKDILNLNKVIEKLATGSGGSGICKSCWMKVEWTFDSMRSDIWNDLLEYFGHNSRT